MGRPKHCGYNLLNFVTFVDLEYPQISSFMEKVYDFLVYLDGFIGGHPWFVILLLGTGIFFTLYLKFPQFRYFRHAVRVVKGKFDKKEDVGDAAIPIIFVRPETASILLM